MIPASFIPMILKKLFPQIDKRIEESKMEIIEHIFKIGKLEENNRYRELPNETDLEVKKHKEHINMLAGEISALEDRLKKLEILYGKPKKVKSK